MASVTNQISPAVTGHAVTPTDNTDLTNGPARSLYVGVFGDVAVVLANDTVAIVFKNVPAGTILPVFAKYVQATGTTATNILALY